MTDQATKQKPGFSIDWLVKGSLTKIGDIFDRLTGRGWKPSSSLATSELVERMKTLLDAEVRENGDRRKYVPHYIRLKMQWDKFSTDSETALIKLENELLIAAVDHINDKHYFTHAPLSIEVKPDYFTSGVMLLAGFEKLEGDDADAGVNVTLDGLKTSELLAAVESEKLSETLTIRFTVAGNQHKKTIVFEEGRRISVGRTKENGLQIDDPSVSKTHASLMLAKEGKLVVADTGSTNGTFVRGERIPYGKAIEMKRGEGVMVGLVKVSIEFAEKPPKELLPKTESFKVGDMEFTTRPPSEMKPLPQPAPTAPSLPIPMETQPPPVPAPTVASLPIQKEAIPIQKPATPPVEQALPERNQFATNVAPQPALSEADISIDKEKTGPGNDS